LTYSQPECRLQKFLSNPSAIAVQLSWCTAIHVGVPCRRNSSDRNRPEVSAPHSRNKVGADGKRRQPRQAFNIVLSTPASTPPEKVLQAVKKFAREEFAHQHRYVMALHAEQKDGHGKHPHMHLVVKAEHEFGGER